MMNEVDKIIREHFDLSDKYTRQYIVGLEEADKEAVLDALANQLYDQIVSNIDQIDFGTIPKSRGDITKVENFEKTEQCLSVMRKLVLEYKQNPAAIDTISGSIQNIKDLKGPFIKGFALDVEFPILMYNLMVLCIERSVSMIIATCVEFVSDPKTKTIKQALDKVAYTSTQEDVMYKQLVTFNTLCKDGTMLKLLDATIKNNRRIRESSDEYDIYNTPEDNDIDATMPVEVSEDDDPVVMTNPFGDDDPIADEIPATPSPDPEYAASQEIPSQEPVIGAQMSDDEPTDTPEPDDLPVTEPDDAPEPIPVQVPVQQQEIAPDVTPNPDEDPNLTGQEEPVIETDPEGGDAEPAPASDTSQSSEPQVSGTNAEPKEYVPDPNAKEPYTEAIIPDSAKQAIAQNVVKVAKAVPVVAAGTLATLAVANVVRIAFVKILIPGLRDLVYNYMYTRFKISDYWRIQAEFLEANADELENSSSDMDPEKKEKIIKRQRKWAETFRKWSNLFSLDKKKAESEAEKKKKEDEKNKKKVATNDDGEDVLF